MKKDGRFWILVGALVVVAGLFVGFLWTVMAAPGEPVVNQAVANVTTTVGNDVVTVESDKPTAPESDMLDTSAVTPPPPAVPTDAQQAIRDAEAASRNAMEQVERAQSEAQARIDAARARAERARREARERTERARRQARALADDKPPDDGKPPEDW